MISKPTDSNTAVRPAPQPESDLNDPTKAPGIGISPAEDQPTARDLAEETIDELTDDRASDADMARRKRELIDGPAELRDVRRDVER